MAIEEMLKLAICLRSVGQGLSHGKSSKRRLSVKGVREKILKMLKIILMWYLRIRMMQEEQRKIQQREAQQEKVAAGNTSSRKTKKIPKKERYADSFIEGIDSKLSRKHQWMLMPVIMPRLHQCLVHLRLYCG